MRPRAVRRPRRAGSEAAGAAAPATGETAVHQWLVLADITGAASDIDGLLGKLVHLGPATVASEPGEAVVAFRVHAGSGEAARRFVRETLDFEATSWAHTRGGALHWLIVEVAPAP